MPIRTKRAKSGMKRVFKKEAKATDGPLNKLAQEAFQNAPSLRAGLRSLQNPTQRKAAPKATRGLRFNKSGRKTKVVV